MARPILMEELHLTVFAPGGLPPAEYDAMHRALSRRSFRARLRRAARRVLGRYRVLGPVRLTLTR